MIRFLTDHPDVQIKAIIDGTGLNRETLRHALDDLQEIGFVTTDREPDERHRRHLRYSVDRVALARAMSELYAYVLDAADDHDGEPAEPASS